LRSQQFYELGKGSIRMVGYKLANFLFVRFEFRFETMPLRLGGDAPCLATLLKQSIEPRATHFVVHGKVIDRNTAIVIFQNTGA
jgi:hypothetical protein